MSTRAKLAASGLSLVDRRRIEDDFRTRRQGLTDPRFSLNLREDARVARMPPSLVSKVLDDTLATWARRAAERKGALRYNIPVFSKTSCGRTGSRPKTTSPASISFGRR